MMYCIIYSTYVFCSAVCYLYIILVYHTHCKHFLPYCNFSLFSHPNIYLHMVPGTLLYFCIRTTVVNLFHADCCLITFISYTGFRITLDQQGKRLIVDCFYRCRSVYFVQFLLFIVICFVLFSICCFVDCCVCSFICFSRCLLLRLLLSSLRLAASATPGALN